MSGHSLEREARGYIRERRAIRRPQAVRVGPESATRRDLMEALAGVFVLLLWAASFWLWASILAVPHVQ